MDIAKMNRKAEEYVADLRKRMLGSPDSGPFQEEIFIRVKGAFIAAYRSGFTDGEAAVGRRETPEPPEAA